jgi:hypothetical protein
MHSDDSFTDYDQLNYLVLTRIANALELKNKSRNSLFQTILDRERSLKFQREENDKLRTKIISLKKRIEKIKKAP